MMIPVIAPMMLAGAATAPSAGPLWEMVPPVDVFAEPCSLPAAAWGTVMPAGPDRDTIRLAVEPGKVSWNGQPIDEQALRSYVRIAATIVPRPRTILYGAGADCPELRRIAALVVAEAGCTPGDCTVIYGPPPRPVRYTMPPAPPAPPGPPSSGPERVGKRPTPRGAPQRWVINDDYPAEAVRAYWMGTTGFRLQIDTQGKVSDCEITSSSGYPVLDEATCSLLKRRALFNPAEDAQGVAIASTWSSRFRWELPTTNSPLASWVHVTRYQMDASGAVSNCTVKLFGPVPEGMFDLCARKLPVARDPAIWGDKPVWIELRNVHLVDRSPLRFPPAIGEPMFQRTIRYTLNADGNVTACKVAVMAGRDIRSAGQRYDCHSALSYLRADALLNPERAITYTMWVSVTKVEP